MVVVISNLELPAGTFEKEAANQIVGVKRGASRHNSKETLKTCFTHDGRLSLSAASLSSRTRQQTHEKSCYNRQSNVIAGQLARSQP